MFVVRSRSWLVAVCLVLSTTLVEACPFCQPTKTLSQELADQAAVAEAELVGGEPATEEEAGTSVYCVKSVLKPFENQPRVSSEITLIGASNLPKGTRVLMLGGRVGKANPKLTWSTRLELSGERLAYITQSPDSKKSARERLNYYRSFLEHSDVELANDAYAEFANARFEDIIELKDELPRSKIRQWLFDAKTPSVRLPLYGLFLGICGTEDDAKKLAAHITTPTQEMRLGIDGMIAGYLWLKGAEGLERVSASHLDAKGSVHPETYAVLQAIRFMWQYGEGRIAPERLQAAVRRLLDREQYAELAIVDLSRWKDWSQLDRMCELAENSAADARLREAALRFVLACSRDIPKDAVPDAPLPSHVLKSRATLESLRVTAPKLVQAIEHSKS